MEWFDPVACIAGIIAGAIGFVVGYLAGYARRIKEDK